MRTFKSTDAEEAWNKFKELWQYVTPASTNYGFMQEPLLTGEVWVPLTTPRDWPMPSTRSPMNSWPSPRRKGRKSAAICR